MEKNKGEIIQRRQTINNIPVYNIQPYVKQQHNKLEHRITAFSMVGMKEKENSGLLVPQFKIQQCQKTKNNNYIKIDYGLQLIEKYPTQVQSIIFNSKITQFKKQSNVTRASQSRISSLKHSNFLNRFQIQVDTLNSKIEAEFSNIEEALRKLKHKKQLKCKNKVQKLTLISNELKQQFKTIQNISKEATSESYIQVQQDIDTQKDCFPQEYISLIRRLSRQIDRDIQFTSKVNFYTKNNLITQIREHCLKEIAHHNLQEAQFDLSFLKIQPAEIDPLDNKIIQQSQTTNTHQINRNAAILMKEYQDLQMHYGNKLYKQFQPSTIKLLFKQLCQFNFASPSSNNMETVTVGHLLSYINMRTNKSFRNRSFVKMLKRLNLKPNSILNLQAFVQLIKP